MSTTPFRVLSDEAPRRADERGHLDVLYEVGEIVLKRSFSRAGVFRGMHWQRPPRAQTKIIRVASGRILDLVMDPTESVPVLHQREISPEDGWVMIGAEWAHGFYAIEDTEFEYLCIGAYDESAELCFSIVDHLRDVLGLDPVLSAKDRAARLITVVAHQAARKSGGVA
jgi:dTDP-4-dehydrorhamnose 3,5-epimerase